MQLPISAELSVSVANRRMENTICYSLVRRGIAVLGSLLFFINILGGLPAEGGDAGLARQQAAPNPSVIFPLSVATSKRYLQDAEGRPFYIHGDAAWSFIAELTREEADIYLSDRRDRGFNTLLVSLIEHRFSTNPPANAYDQNPFTTGGDFATPNEAYFVHADWALRRAGEFGFLVLLVPAYMGYNGEEDGWYQEMVASGASNLLAYGRFLGRRYSNFENIIWVHAGDYNPPDKNLVRAIAKGIIETAPASLHTVHCAPETAARDYWLGEPWLALNTTYTYDRVHSAAVRQSSRTPQMPSIVIESAYENEHGATEQRLRMQAYDALLSGAAGHVFGNNPVWHFDAPGLYPAPVNWRDALGSRGAQSMRHLRTLVDQLEWWSLEPSERLIVDHPNQSYWNRIKHWISAGMIENAVGAIARNRSFAVVYLPSVRDIEIDLSLLTGERVTGRWFDPSVGGFAVDETDVVRHGTYTFRPPGRNRAGYEDWVLLLRAQSR